MHKILHWRLLKLKTFIYMLPWFPWVAQIPGWKLVGTIEMQMSFLNTPEIFTVILYTVYWFIVHRHHAAVYALRDIQ